MKEEKTMKSICGADCDNCQMNTMCKGCAATNGSPFGGHCPVAKCITVGGEDSFKEFKAQVIKEINEQKIKGMPFITDLFALCGSFVNLEYPLPGGGSFRLLEDKNIYLGNQVELPDCGRCYGIAADEKMIVISEYGREGANPELVFYKRR